MIKRLLLLSALVPASAAAAQPIAVGVGLGSYGAGLSIQGQDKADTFVQGLVGATGHGRLLLNLDYAFTAPLNPVLKVYVGPGVTVHNTGVGPRLPLGLLYQPASLPLQLGAEVAPTVIFGGRDNWGFFDVALYARAVIK